MAHENDTNQDAGAPLVPLLANEFDTLQTDVLVWVSRYDTLRNLDDQGPMDLQSLKVLVFNWLVDPKITEPDFDTHMGSPFSPKHWSFVSWWQAFTSRSCESLMPGTPEIWKGKVEFLTTIWPAPFTEIIERENWKTRLHNICTGRSRRTKKLKAKPKAKQPLSLIFDKAQVLRLRAPILNMRNMQTCLERLVVMFPNIRVDVFRELLHLYRDEGYSKLAVVADVLIRRRDEVIKGRFREPEDQWQIRWPLNTDKADAADRKRLGNLGYLRRPLPDVHLKRSPEYRAAAKRLATKEFPGVTKPEVMAALAGCNLRYLEARRVLAARSNRHWRGHRFHDLIRNRTTLPDDPLLRWEARNGPGVGDSAEPCIESTGSAELDAELFEALVQPILDERYTQKMQQDAESRAAEFQDAVRLGAVVECESCFSSVTHDAVALCSRQGHFVCRICIKQAVSEATFGLAFRSTIDLSTGSLRCLAATDVNSQDCDGVISGTEIRGQLRDLDGCLDLLRRFDRRFAEHALLATNLRLLRCPLCDYAEVDDIYLPESEQTPRIRVKTISRVFCIALCIIWIPFLVSIASLSHLCDIFSRASTTRPSILEDLDVHAAWARAIRRYHCRNRSLRFQCRDPHCSRTTCLRCHAPWADGHSCTSDEANGSMRMYVDEALTRSVKRECPRCATAFVLARGCNKMTCRCGLTICYVCCADISSNGYQHFCQHFREPGDGTPCKVCDRCNLWQDTGEISKTDGRRLDMNQLRQQAELEWRASQKRKGYRGRKSRRAISNVFGVVDAHNAGEAANPLQLLAEGEYPQLDDIADCLVASLF
ncbi:E3 ubiquitin-protein ligase RNF216 [Ceratocystis fimbriata CBS 114723]|uniref:E3 ubiquitin-protein ligase RNF216 n=1 Tax=Ceratocystis fimbriata CBS 114723 TaxID=1035309 RepID=A0A2C5XFQ5_9PEZI|nr:E3 ubiquitin-protein ligase RNF216 [Ceratocystis fimbriata CBS 114723]